MHRWSPIPLRWSVAGLSLVRLLVTRLLVLLLESWSVFRRWSICSSLIGPSTAVVVTGLTAGRFARSSLVHPFGSCHSWVCSTRGRSSVCSGRGHWLARPYGSLLLVCRWPWSSICHSHIARASARLVVGVSLVCRWCVVGVSLVCRWCVVGVSLVCRWCVTDLSLSYSCSWSLVRRSSICSSVWSCVCSSQVCLSLVRHSSLTGLSVRVVVTVCSSIAGPSARCSLVCRWSARVMGARLSAGLSARVVHRSSVSSGHGR